jgi:DNA-binding beta-propeller fold protein YncE
MYRRNIAFGVPFVMVFLLLALMPAVVAADSPPAFLFKFGSPGVTGDGEFDQPNGVAVDAAGNVYVVEYGYHHIQKFTSSGAFLTKWGTPGTGDGQFQVPAGVAVDAAGKKVYVADQVNHRIQVFGPAAPVDATPPSASPTQSPAANINGWNNTDVTVNWNWSDSGSGINPANCTTSSTSAGEGMITLNASCKDIAGNTGNATYTVKVDKTAPTVACGATPNKLWPPNHKLVPVNVTVAVADALLGPAGFTLASVASNEPDNGLGDGDTPNDIQGFAVGTADTSGQRPRVHAELHGYGPGREQRVLRRNGLRAPRPGQITADIL